jgi:outer membrane protein OmpA-like peptidoglycan-associated protein/Tol biopolymer transport system component
MIIKSKIKATAVAITAVVMMLTVSAAAQDIPKKALKYFNEANYDIGLEQFGTAKEKLAQAINVYPEYEQARLYLADIHYTEGDYAAALEQYGWIRDHGPHASRVELFMARSAFQLMDFDRTIALLDDYLSNETISDRARNNAKQLKINAQFSKSAVANAYDFEPHNLGDSVNSEHNEYLPALNADETTVIFTRKLRGQEDLFVTGMEGRAWKKAAPIDEGTINTGHNEGAHCISADGRTLLYTICNERFTRGSCDLYISRLKKDGWSPPRNLGPPLNSVAWDSQPTLSADGKSIYFVSNRRGGYGGFDLYVSHYNGEQWGEPENLGPVINTANDDQAPFIHFDNRTLYFSSDGHPGMGKQDLFFSRLEDGQWSEPVNMGYPVNTSAEESGLCISLDGTKAYYAAERSDGKGGLDIYAFDLPDFARPERVTYVKGRILDSETGQPVNAQILLQDLTGETGQISRIAIDGEFLVCLPSGSNYSLHVKEEGYVFESLNFSLKDTVQRQAFVLDINLHPVAPGHVVILRNIFFETDSFSLMPASGRELEELFLLLEKYPAVRVEISGHTDSTGDRDYNMALSEKRAQSVVNYLVAKGIGSDRLIAVGSGPDRPIADNTTPEGRAENRRTEFRILE